MIYLRCAQTTAGDLGFAVRSVGISLGPGLVDAGSAEVPRIRGHGLGCRRGSEAFRRTMLSRCWFMIYGIIEQSAKRKAR